MNFAEKLTKDLEANGMFTDQAEAVVDTFMRDPISDNMNGRWEEDVSAYPEGLYNVLWAMCKVTALKYIDANCPKAWFRPVFLPPKEQEEFLLKNTIPSDTSNDQDWKTSMEKEYGVNAVANSFSSGEIS